LLFHLADAFPGAIPRLVWSADGTVIAVDTQMWSLTQVETAPRAHGRMKNTVSTEAAGCRTQGAQDANKEILVQAP
jgi:hypothetical protein